MGAPVSGEEARLRVFAALAATDAAPRVYEIRARPGRKAGPDVVVMDANGSLARVRVLVGKRPRTSTGRVYFDERRVGSHADILAVVDPLTGGVDFRPVPPRSGLRVPRRGEVGQIVATGR